VNCPFLREAQVRSCQASHVRKLIVDGIGTAADVTCLTEQHVNCASFHEQHAVSDGPARCPFLHERLMQYCGVQAVPKMVPYSELSRCGSESYRYCELYLDMARPRKEQGSEQNPGEVWQVEGIPVPSNLYYTSNHMWLDVHESGSCHIGIDGFLARLIGTLDRVSFVTMKGVNRPAAVLTMGGVDWPITFPNPLLISSANVYLRGNASRLTTDPYGSGWLFEGWQPPAGATPRRGLVSGQRAMSWMTSEVQRLSGFVQECAMKRAPEGEAALCDGGAFVPGLLDHLTRDEMFLLLHEFFGPRPELAAE
jgi:glycine cleavage system H lipoate-binding protein